MIAWTFDSAVGCWTCGTISWRFSPPRPATYAGILRSPGLWQRAAARSEAEAP